MKINGSIADSKKFSSKNSSMSATTSIRSATTTSPSEISSSIISKKGPVLEDCSKSTGIDEIDALFARKKEIKKESIIKAVEEKKRRLQDDDSNDNERKKAAQKLTGDRTDLERLKAGEWVDDGLGGKFNADAYTGRREDGSGLKVFKAHLFNKKGFGTTKECPFDCDCCFI
mmetsp:Transcript_18121/g.25797  ORF Transcript_18121/g.25797 Transcript_18121/m.25797 type:complete len:172 (+) Transcript_18121:57-572(+)